MQNDVLATGIMSFIMHEVVYFGRSAPFMIMDCIPYFKQYKLQNVRRIVARHHIATLVYSHPPSPSVSLDP